MDRQNRAARDGGARTNLYDEITAKIINELEQGRLPWVQPWGDFSARRTQNGAQSERTGIMALTWASIRSRTIEGTASRSGSFHQCASICLTVSRTVLRTAGSGSRARLAKAFHRGSVIALNARSPPSDKARLSAGI
ncbi:DUF1738 domain-containing protein [Sinorhizobium medicae]|nr:DUF1738 domain-containing protein [Sinorhizobium medicae]